MSTYTIPTGDGEEARITIEPGNSVGYPAHGIYFNHNADIIAETRTTTYHGYCTQEILCQEIPRLLTILGRDVPDYEVLDYMVTDATGLTCDCDDDDMEEAE